MSNQNKSFSHQALWMSQWFSPVFSSFSVKIGGLSEISRYQLRLRCEIQISGADQHLHKPRDNNTVNTDRLITEMPNTFGAYFVWFHRQCFQHWKQIHENPARHFDVLRERRHPKECGSWWETPFESLNRCEIYSYRKMEGAAVFAINSHAPTVVNIK